jgi:putative component of membrane protein insertase Oxa1/YidC/SpoIIIJ protein YidD
MNLTGRPRQLVTAGLSIACSFVLLHLWAPEGFVGQSLSDSAVGLIHFYQRSIRPLNGNHVRCRLRPTCSNYALREFSDKPLMVAAAGVSRRLVACARTRPPAFGPAQVSTGNLPLAALLQRRSGDEAAAAACCASFGFVIFFIVALFILSVILLVWVAKDAKNRGVDNPILWMILVFFTGVIGLIIYLAVRPSGNLIPCLHCPNKKLPYAKICPHCGQADARALG